MGGQGAAFRWTLDSAAHRKSRIQGNRVCGPPIDRRRRRLAFYGIVPTKSGGSRADSPNNGWSDEL